MTEPHRVILMVAALLLACAVPLSVHARQSDRSKQIHVSADGFKAADKPNGIVHLTGHVVITQGSLKATGTEGTAYLDAHSHVKRVVLTGSPARLRQVNNHGDLIKGHADTIDYNVFKGMATLTGHACVKQVGRSSACGAKLVYNTATSTMRASGRGHHRVHLTFQPHQSSSSAKPKPAPATSTGGH